MPGPGVQNGKPSQSGRRPLQFVLSQLVLNSSIIFSRILCRGKRNSVMAGKSGLLGSGVRLGLGQIVGLGVHLVKLRPQALIDRLAGCVGLVQQMHAGVYN